MGAERGGVGHEPDIHKRKKWRFGLRIGVQHPHFDLRLYQVTAGPLLAITASVVAFDSRLALSVAYLFFYPTANLFRSRLYSFILTLISS